MTTKIYPEVDITIGHFVNSESKKDTSIIILSNVRIRYAFIWYLIPVEARMSSTKGLNFLSEAFTMFNKMVITAQTSHTPTENFLDPNQED